VNTNHESVAYRSFSPSTFEARGARKVTTGMNCTMLSGDSGVEQARGIALDIACVVTDRGVLVWAWAVV
jgi:hypothetical protein